jgi:hypothetical protein
MPKGAIRPDLVAVAWGAIGLAISHTASFVINFVGRGEYRRVSAARQMFAPYGRLVILHLTILFGAFVSLAIGSPAGAVMVNGPLGPVGVTPEMWTGSVPVLVSVAILVCGVGSSISILSKSTSATVIMPVVALPVTVTV